MGDQHECDAQFALKVLQIELHLLAQDHRFCIVQKEEGGDP